VQALTEPGLGQPAASQSSVFLARFLGFRDGVGGQMTRWWADRPGRDEYLHRYPHLAHELGPRLDEIDAEAAGGPLSAQDGGREATVATCPLNGETALHRD
jgi:hypothetical protein